MGITVTQAVCLLNQLLKPGLYSATHLSFTEKNALIDILCRWRVVFYMQPNALRIYPSLSEANLITDCSAVIDDVIYVIDRQNHKNETPFREMGHKAMILFI